MSIVNWLQRAHDLSTVIAALIDELTGVLSIKLLMFHSGLQDLYVFLCSVSVKLVSEMICGELLYFKYIYSQKRIE